MKVFGDKNDFEPIFLALDKNKAVYKDVKGIIKNLKKNIIVGERIEFSRIPKYYKKRHGIDNAFHIYLPEGMRLIYSITKFKGRKTAFLMELSNHKNYDQRFK